MKSKHVICNYRGRLLLWAISACLALVATGCASIKLSPAAEKADPGDERDATVKVYFNEDGCPLFTLFDGQPGGTPGVDKNDRITWEAKSIAGSRLPEDFKFAVIFDPIQGGRPLVGETEIANIRLADSDKIPANVSFKYTIVKVTSNNGTIDTNCPALDPMIRIL